MVRNGVEASYKSRELLVGELAKGDEWIVLVPRVVSALGVRWGGGRMFR